MDFSDLRGQASIDYLAVLAVVAVLFGAAAAAVGAPWLAPRVATGIRHGICVVSGALCTPGEAAQAGLTPCPIHRWTAAERLGAVAVFRLTRGDSLVVQRRSDGTASVSFVDGGELGIEAGAGVSLPGVAGSVSAAAGVRFAAGQTFEFSDWPEARRFLARFAGEESLGGEARRALRALCWKCPEWLEGRGRALPEPAARYYEGGSYDSFAAELGATVPTRRRRGAIKVGLDLEGGRGLVLGRRTSGRQVTWYLRLQGEVVSALGAVLGSLQAARQTEGVLEITTEGGKPVRAGGRASAAMTGAVGLAGAQLDVGEVVDRLRAAAVAPGVDADADADADADHGVAVEAEVALDLRDAANLRAIEGLVRPGSSPLGWLERIRAVGRRLDVAGAVDLRVLRLARARMDHTQEIGSVVRLGGGYSRVDETRELMAAWSLRPGGRLRRREDCEAAARAAA